MKTLVDRICTNCMYLGSQALSKRVYPNDEVYVHMARNLYYCNYGSSDLPREMRGLQDRACSHFNPSRKAIRFFRKRRIRAFLRRLTKTILRK